MGRRTLPLNFGGGTFLDKHKWMEFPCERGPLPKTTTWMDWWLEDAAGQSWNPLGNLITSLLFGERALFMRLCGCTSFPCQRHHLCRGHGTNCPITTTELVVFDDAVPQQLKRSKLCGNSCLWQTEGKQEKEDLVRQVLHDRSIGPTALTTYKFATSRK